MKRDFAAVRHVKPKASRSDSAELFVLASGFGAAEQAWRGFAQVLKTAANLNPRADRGWPWRFCRRTRTPFPST